MLYFFAYFCHDRVFKLLSTDQFYSLSVTQWIVLVIKIDLFIFIITFTTYKFSPYE